MAIRAVLFDFGGVITSSPFDAFTQLEEELGLPADFIRTVNATNPDENAWARLERSEVDLDTFASLWSDEARALGHEVDGRAVLERLAGRIRPEMVAAIRTCRGSYKTGCLTNNFGSADSEVSAEVAAVYELFDVVLESRTLGVRKPDPRLYELACSALDVQPEECVFLDDLGVNLKPARTIGMQHHQGHGPRGRPARAGRGAPACPSTESRRTESDGTRWVLRSQRGARLLGLAGRMATGSTAEERAVPETDPAGVVVRRQAGRGASCRVETRDGPIVAIERGAVGDRYADPPSVKVA